MSANFLNTNRNATRYFFATSEAGEQDLSLEFGSTGGVPNLSTMSVALSGGGGSVVVNQAPQFVASQFVAGEDAVLSGTNSQYFTMSTLTSTLTGVNISTDRLPGTGVACIESYGGNGSLGGIEFLSRGLDAELISTTNAGINSYMSSIGRPGASAVIGSSGTILSATGQASQYQSIDVATGGGGRVAYGINDLSGVGGVQSLARWGIGTSAVPTGGNVGSDFTIYAYADDGSFLSSDMRIRRSDGAMAIQNISSVQNFVSSGVYAPVFPCTKDNTEFGIPSVGNTAPISGVLQVLFSTPVSGLNPNLQTLLNINWGHALSTASAYVDYKIGFSTATAYTNVLTTAYVEGGGWTPGGSYSTISHLNTCCILDPDGIEANGTGMLYVAGRMLNGSNDTIYIDKGTVSEATRNALCYRPI